MNLLLYKYNEINSTNIANIASSYEKYFKISTENNQILIFLDSNILKNYLINGIEIKYRQYIFFFLKNINDIRNNKYYKLINNINFTNSNNFINESINDFNKICNLSLSINNKNNIFYLKDKNIIKLNKNFYADLENERFYFKKIQNKKYNYNGIILNYDNKIKNKLMVVSCINYLNSNNNKIINKYKNYYDEKTNQNIILQINTKCNLIITDLKNINKWKNIINKNVLIIKSEKDILKLTYKDILNNDFLIVNIYYLLGKYYKNYFYKYGNDINRNIKELIISSLYDTIKNKFIDIDLFKNFHLINWNNVIYDNIENIVHLDSYNIIFLLTANNTKYYLHNSDYNIQTSINISDKVLFYIINNSIYLENSFISSNIFIENNIGINLLNFYKFIKDLLLIKNNDSLNIISDSNKFIKSYYEEVIPTNIEKETYNILIENNINIDKVYTFFINPSKYIFEYTNKEGFNKLIENKNNIYCQKSIDSLYEQEQEQENNKNICSICYDLIKKEQISIILCGHFFCKSCIIKYIKNKTCNECPICREKFYSNQIYSLNDDLNYNSKLNKIIDFIDNFNSSNILILSQHNESLSYIENILYKNNKKFINITNKKYTKKTNNLKIHLSTFDNILNNDTYILSRNKILCIDFPVIKKNDNPIYILKQRYIDYSIIKKIDLLEFYFIYMKDTLEENIIETLYKKF
jgi:hypothetical protein